MCVLYYLKWSIYVDVRPFLPFFCFTHKPTKGQSSRISVSQSYIYEYLNACKTMEERECRSILTMVCALNVETLRFTELQILLFELRVWKPSLKLFHLPHCQYIFFFMPTANGTKSNDAVIFGSLYQIALNACKFMLFDFLNMVFFNVPIYFSQPLEMYVVLVFISGSLVPFSELPTQVAVFY